MEKYRIKTDKYHYNGEESSILVDVQRYGILFLTFLEVLFHVCNFMVQICRSNSLENK